jgi:hypothetical protein
MARPATTTRRTSTRAAAAPTCKSPAAATRLTPREARSRRRSRSARRGEQLSPQPSSVKRPRRGVGAAAGGAAGALHLLAAAAGAEEVDAAPTAAAAGGQGLFAAHVPASPAAAPGSPASNGGGGGAGGDGGGTGGGTDATAPPAQPFVGSEPQEPLPPPPESQPEPPAWYELAADGEPPAGAEAEAAAEAGGGPAGGAGLAAAAAVAVEEGAAEEAAAPRACPLAVVLRLARLGRDAETALLQLAGLGSCLDEADATLLPGEATGFWAVADMLALRVGLDRLVAANALLVLAPRQRGPYLLPLAAAAGAAGAAEGPLAKAAAVAAGADAVAAAMGGAQAAAAAAVGGPPAGCLTPGQGASARCSGGAGAYEVVPRLPDPVKGQRHTTWRVKAARCDGYGCMCGPGKRRETMTHIAALKGVTGSPRPRVPATPWTGGSFALAEMAEWLASCVGGAAGPLRRRLVMHLCGNPLCFNPWHLVWGTDLLNTQKGPGSAAAQAAGLAAALGCLAPAAWLGLGEGTDARLGPAVPLLELSAVLSREFVENRWVEL